MDEEARLVEAARAGAEDAFSDLVRRHQARVRTYLARYVRDRALVDDLGQETFLAAFRGLPTYKGEVSLAFWLLGIARKQALMYLRGEERRLHRERKKVQSAVASWLAGEVESHSAGPLDHDDELSALEHCLKRLPEKSARLVREFYFEDRTAVEIAREAERSDSTIWVALLRVREALRRCMEGQLAAKRATS